MDAKGVTRARCRAIGRRLLVVLAGVVYVASAPGQAGSSRGSGPKQLAALGESVGLPDAPVPAAAIVSAAGEGGQAPGQKADPGVQKRVAVPFDKFIGEGEIAPQLTAGDKVLMGIRGSVSPYAVIGWISSATYSEAIDGSPHYGQNGKDYLQRLGAASAKATSEDIFTVSVLAPVLHEDPRYYQMGRGHSFLSRFGYAVTRVLVTKTDTGSETVNFAVLGGNFAGSALTQAYYPPDSRGVGEVMKSFGTSLLGQGVGDLFQEFILSSAEFLQLKRRVPGI